MFRSIIDYASTPDDSTSNINTIIKPRCKSQLSANTKNILLIESVGLTVYIAACITLRYKLWNGLKGGVLCMINSILALKVILVVVLGATGFLLLNSFHDQFSIESFYFGIKTI